MSGMPEGVAVRKTGNNAIVPRSQRRFGSGWKIPYSFPLTPRYSIIMDFTFNILAFVSLTINLYNPV